MNAGYAQIESLARDSYGRLLAYLAARSGDVAGAEDALSEAFLAALQRWPAEGVPEKPEAWLLTAARRRMIDVARHAAVRSRAAETLSQITEMAHSQTESGELFPDERLKLLFVCAHPAIDAPARTPLMLQTVLGLDAARIASAFLTSPTAMSQRLVRAKMKIRDAGIPFSIPAKEELAARLQSVLEAIYAAYTCGWDAGEDTTREGLVNEALWLGRLVAGLLPQEPEALGLLALMLHSQARHDARRDAEGRFVPLPEQEVSQWSEEKIREAESLLTRASAEQMPGRFQLEAAIQSVHAQRRWSGVIDWRAIAFLYEGLLHFSPTVGAQIGRAVAVAQTQEAAQGVLLLDEIPLDKVRNHQPYWAARAHLLVEAGRMEEGRVAYQRAIGLSDNTVLRKFLQQKIQDL